MLFKVEPVGIISSCYTEKFGIPRQPGMVKSSFARLEFLSPFNRKEMVRGLEQFSHIWIHFVFHESLDEGWSPTVRPPWLGGKKRVGVFSTRSPHRPNNLGMSVVRLQRVITEEHIALEISGVDLLDGTPVVDVKPYVPYSDSIPDALCGFARGKTAGVEVRLTEQVETFCKDYEAATGRALAQLIVETLGQDPRPASQKETRSGFGMMFWDINVRWRVEGGLFVVESCEHLGVEE